MQRQRDGFSVDDSCKNIAQHLKTISCLNYLPNVICIDSVPFRSEDYLEEYRTSLGNREIILELIRGIPSIPVSGLQFTKTPVMEMLDERTIQRLNGEIAGYKTSLVQHEKVAREVMGDIDALLSTLQGQQDALEDDRQALVEYKSDVEQQVATWTTSRNWSFTWHIAKYCLVSNFPISRVQKSKPVNFRWTKNSNTEYTASGELVGDWFMGVQASVTTYAKKSDVYAVKIKSWKNTSHN